MAGKKDNKATGKDAGGKGGKGKGGQGAAEPKDAAKVKGAQSIVVRHILCDKLSKKDEALAMLKSGTAWSEVVKTYSTELVRSGGLIGEKKKGDLDPEFEKVAFALPAYKDGVKDYPYGDVKTGFGYHIIRVDSRK